MALKVLSALDSARTQWYHFKAIIVAGMGLFTDAYDLFCIPSVMKLIAAIHYHDDANYDFPSAIYSVMLGTSLLGTVVGQLLFGHLGDRIGRRKVYGLSLMLMVVSSLLCGLSLGTSRACVMLSLGFFRFTLGLGIGGDYPLSATIMSEFANRWKRGAFIAAVFSMQGFGILVSSAVTMAVCAAFDRATGSAAPDEPTPWVADLAWRLILMLGALPAALTYYWRMMMPETARYTALVKKDVEQAAIDMQKVLSVSLSQITEEVEEDEEEEEVSRSYINPQSSTINYPLFSKHFLRRHGRDLFACAACWLMVDVVYYSNNLFASHIYNPHPNRSSQNHRFNAFREALHVAKIQTLISISSTIPGYFATVFSIDRVGRVKIQMMGFLFMALALVATGIPYRRFWEKKANAGFLILYGLTFFFSNFGPNTTTFIVPAELFPARLRSTCHGISGAAGKVGAILGSIGFLWASRDDLTGKDKGSGIPATLVTLAGVCVVGMIVTYFFTFETNERSLEDNEKADDGTNGAWVLRGFGGGDLCRRRPPPQESSGA
ncbi:probable inorganic phosphate transporter 1-9 [Andrographis paniculata]|uniref:probable inorganic phosphate transporter 1-9 n=1 Tax=Andrographis paniculata TaxID=175694 RepID=UPI0021E8AB33|nr:probable inorganic phosphate transporter 1-9 [Andrographis paniculata]